MNTRTMNNVPHKNKLNVGSVQLHVEPPLICLIKSKHDDKSEKDFGKKNCVGI